MVSFAQTVAIGIRQTGEKDEHAELQSPKQHGVGEPSNKLIFGSADSEPILLSLGINGCTLFWRHAAVGKPFPLCADIIGHSGFSRIQSLRIGI